MYICRVYLIEISVISFYSRNKVIKQVVLYQTLHLLIRLKITAQRIGRESYFLTKKLHSSVQCASLPMTLTSKGFCRFIFLNYNSPFTSPYEHYTHLLTKQLNRLITCIDMASLEITLELVANKMGGNLSSCWRRRIARSSAPHC